MKIGLNARFLMHPYTGIGKYTFELVRALSKIDEENEYLLFVPEPVDVELPENFQQIRLPEKHRFSGSVAKAHWEHTLLPDEMEKLNIDLAHFLYPSNPLKKLSIPTIVTVHDAIPWVLPEYRQKIRSKAYHSYAKQALKNADHLISVSEFSKQEIHGQLKKLSEERITVIHEGPSSKQSSLMPDIPLRKRFLLYVGGYDHRKNVPLLMEAYQKHIANHNEIDLVLVGAAGLGLEIFLTDYYQEKVDGKFPVKTKGQIIFTPPLSEEELSFLYKEAHAFVHASMYEGFNLPLVEAMSFGLPIVAADIPVNREVAQEAAFFTDPATPDTFGLKIHELLHHKKLQDKLKEKAKKRSQDFSWEKCAKKTMEVYELFSR